jgi:hypothetical protein
MCQQVPQDFLLIEVVGRNLKLRFIIKDIFTVNLN